MTWDTSTPANSDFISQGDDKIRELKVDIQTSLRGNAASGTEAIFPGSDTANPVFRYRGLKGNTGARPSFGQYGLYINTTLNTIQRDSGSAWEDVATLIPSGTKMLFYQAAAPTGWTAVAVNDKFLRVVTSGGTGGSTGGSGLAPSSTVTLAHTHTVASHTHDLGNHTHTTPNHTHAIDYTATVGNSSPGNDFVYNAPDFSTFLFSTTQAGSGVTLHKMKDSTKSEGSGTSGAPSSNTSGAATPATDSVLTNATFQYADVIVATKD